LTGEETAVARQVNRTIGLVASGSFAASPAGRLVYLGGTADDRLRLTWFDRAGKRVGASGDPGSIRGVQISPDGKKALVTLADASGQTHVWVQDLERGTRARLSRSAEGESNALWSPEGGKIVFLRGTAVMRISADGSGREETLLDDHLRNIPYSFSPDGKFLAFWSVLPKTGDDIRILPGPLGPAGASKVSTLIGTEFSESHPRISPDGKWIAYSSNESGTPEIVVAPFRSPGAARQISVAGTLRPRWRRDAKELLVLDFAGTILSVDVGTRNGAFDAGPPRALFPLRISETLDDMYDISADGRRILAAVSPEDANPEPLTVVGNWMAGLKK
jgi:Tol biopolymer transport system component